MGFIERLKNDLIYLKGVVRTLKITMPIGKNPKRIFPDVIEELAAKHGDKPALLSDRERFSYREFAARANRYARWAKAQGLAKGDTVCLMMPNRPEYMAVWLGITRVGGVVALINTNLTGAALAHCINIVTPKHVIVGSELLDAFASAKGALTGSGKIWAHGGTSEYPRIDTEVDALPGGAIPASERPELTTEDHALFIYTSGTTGMPKAANINHYRLMLASHGFAGVMDTRPTDRMYVTLPMYHTTGGVVATGAALVGGGSVVIRERFSAREFWDDVVRWECTLFQYIGELCRYLLNTPTSPSESKHKIRLCCGNGLRPDVWVDFKNRFKIPEIREFYAATEGNVSMFNFDGKPGAVGRIPWFLAHRFPNAVVKFDVEKEEPVRDAHGFCIKCEPNEPGEVIGKILNDPSKPGNRFEGYADKASTEKKILRDVFEKGDAWFRTGDLMKQDKDGYYYFVDRIGDTFRRKGENVATYEVAETITMLPGIKEANVYGVTVPGEEGRVGMAALVVEDEPDLAALRQHLVRTLPEYARPLFVRIMSELDVTGTFKQKKVDLVRQGFDPSVTPDPIYYNDPKAQAFVRVDKPLYERLQGRQVRA